jgi:hypothetical protein
MTDKQTITEIIEGLKNEGFVYNDADFSRKTGLKASFVSEMKAGKKPFSELTRQKIEQTFPKYFNRFSIEKLTEDEPTLGEVARMIADHDRRFHDQMERIMDAMGIAPKKVASM